MQLNWNGNTEVSCVVVVCTVFDVSPLKWKFSIKTELKNYSRPIITQFHERQNINYTFHQKAIEKTRNAKKSNGYTNDKINVEFISINIQCKMEFNILLVLCS